jgi:hypothetical protein
MQRQFFIKFLLAIFFSMSFTEVISQTEKQINEIVNPLDSLKYDKVIAYDYDGSKDLQILDALYFSNNKKIFKQKELTKKQIDKLIKTLVDNKSYGGTTAACFDPHFGIIFFYNAKIVGHISICLSCNFLKSTMTIPAIQAHKTKLCDDCYANGFSKPARKKISSLVKELDFSQWKLDSYLFDK